MMTGKRWVVPLVGLVLSVTAHLAQNVWGIAHIDDLTSTIRGFDHAGVLLGFFLIGVIEGTILLCLYLPGTAVLVLLLLGLQPTISERIGLLGWLMAGTMVGYGTSYAAGRALGNRLPLVGGAYFLRMRSFVDRFGMASLAPVSFHPNNLAFAFAALGYFKARRLWLYVLIAAVAQAAWWSLYASLANFIVGQNFVSSSNFQFYLSALFSVWLLYEILSTRRARRAA